MSEPSHHKHLLRQLRKLELDAHTPPSPAAWSALLDRISKTYDEIDSERYTLERSVSLFEREMHDLHRRLEEEVEAVLEQIGRGVPAAGFYSYGEICPSGLVHSCDLHNQTMTLTVFTEAA